LSSDCAPGLLTDIVTDAAGLDPRLGERGMVEGRRSSSPVSRRAPVDLDVLGLTDHRTGVLSVLMFWAGRIRWELKLPRPRLHSMATEVEVLTDHWAWALEESWGPQMATELTSLRDAVYEARHGVKIRPCPVCSEPVRVDRFVAEHAECIRTGP
jgi:hypothetical protein